MRRAVRLLDAALRRWYGIREHSSAPSCIFRLRRSHAEHALRLPDRLVEAGEPVLELHFLNEHMLTFPPGGADVGYARRILRSLYESLAGVAAEVQRNPELRDVVAVGGLMPIFERGRGWEAGAGIMRRIGFTVSPYRNPRGRIAETIALTYEWLLLSAYQPGSLRGRGWTTLRRFDVWTSREELLRRFGAGSGPRASR